MKKILYIFISIILQNTLFGVTTGNITISAPNSISGDFEATGNLSSATAVSSGLVSAGSVTIGGLSPCLSNSNNCPASVTGSWSVTTKGGDFSIGSGETKSIYLVTAQATASLDSATTLGAGFTSKIKRTGSSLVMIQGDGGEIFSNGASSGDTVFLNSAGATIETISDGSNWQIVDSRGTIGISYTVLAGNTYNGPCATSGVDQLITYTFTETTFTRTNLFYDSNDSSCSGNVGARIQTIGDYAIGDPKALDGDVGFDIDYTNVDIELAIDPAFLTLMGFGSFCGVDGSGGGIANFVNVEGADCTDVGGTTIQGPLSNLYNAFFITNNGDNLDFAYAENNSMNTYEFIGGYQLSADRDLETVTNSNTYTKQ